MSELPKLPLSIEQQQLEVLKQMLLELKQINARATAKGKGK